ncbi:FecCD family ABC transporter permease [Psychromonas sp.]|uniref:FecCD family ABC transporter permease n=1 Tax=Psychromonas sp. TaxID=1884585 RepID=UPI00356A40BB
MPLSIHHYVTFLSASVFLVLGVSYSLTAWSSLPLNFTHLYAYLFHFDNSSIEQQILSSIRTPRLLTGMLIGANLAVSGILMQGLTRNPLASPSVLGMNSGAACFIALSSIGMHILGDVPSLLAAAFGGVVSGSLVIFLGGFFSARSNPLRLILAGIAINAFLIGITRAAVILADDRAFSVITWLAGSLANISWQEWHALWPSSVLGLLMALYVAKNLNLLALGNDVAVSLGINIGLTRCLACAAIVLLSASSVAVVGPIGFVGLIVPHIARRLVSNNFLLLIPVSALLGSCLIAWADALSRGIAFPAETPVGVITALIGTPFFVFLTIRNKC